MFNIDPKELTRHFSPAWFASIMGTAVIPLALSFLKMPGKMFLVQLFFYLSLFMFITTLIPWTIRFFAFPENIKKDFNHPVASNFFPTMPISLIVIALNFLKYPELLLTKAASYELAYYLWILGSIGIYVMGFVISAHIYRHKEIQVSHANFGWYIPPVSKLLIPVAGFELAGLFPDRMELTFGLSIVSFGVGFFLFLFVGASVYHRYIYHELPMAKFASTYFIGIAPTAIIAVALFKLMHLLEHHSILGIDGHMFSGIAKLAILLSWGFSIWWFIMGVIIILYYLRKIELPYALSWWAFTFPSGALTVSTGIAWKITHYNSIHLIYLGVTAFLLAVWTLVFIRTAKGMINGKLFLPAH